MKALRVCLLAAMIGGSAINGTAQFFWTGIGNGWLNQNAPAGVGTEDLVFGNAVRHTIPISGNFAIDSVLVTADDDFRVTGPGGTVLTLNSGAAITGFGVFHIEQTVALNLTGSPVFDAGNGRFVLTGPVTGNPANVTLTSTGNAGNFNFNSELGGNSYTGTTTLTSAGTNLVSVSFYNDTPFGSSALSVTGTTQLIAHGTQTLANNFTVNMATPATQPLALRGWDAPLTLSGAFTLQNNLIIQALTSPTNVTAYDNMGKWLVPGPVARHPVIFTGNINESGSGRTLTAGGAGIIILNPSSGSSGYTGGTTVNGSLVFGNMNAIPGTGLITINASSGGNGYAGIADTTAGNWATFISRVSTSSNGAVGVDTLPGASSTTILSEPINLTGFSSTAIRIGTATSAILSGTITPNGLDYRFGNGGGSLYVTSALPDIDGSKVILESALNGGQVAPLKLYLQGSQGYSGGTEARNGFIIFDAPVLPSGPLTAAGTSTSVGASYIGFARADNALSDFTNGFDKTNTWGIVGFDTPPGDLTPAVFTEAIDLTGFNNGVFVGTSSSATLSGIITPTTVANGDNAANTYRFTAGNGGKLTITSQLSGSRAVMIGSPSSAWAYSDGIVSILPAVGNTYTGGTIINTASPITLEVGGTTPLGTGAISFTTLGTAPVGLQTANSGFVLTNDILFPTPGMNEGPTQLHLTGANSFTLGGQISGPGEVHLMGPLFRTITINGNNSAWNGRVVARSSTIFASNNNALGTSSLEFLSPDGIIEFSSSAPAPVIHGIHGDYGELVVPNGTTLTFDTSDDTRDFEFGGNITRDGDGSATTASLVVTASGSGSDLYLYGNNNYTGGTTISGAGALALGGNFAAGSGPITLNSAEAALILNTGVSMANDLNLVAGTLAGLGVFSPANLTSLSFGTDQAVAPGLPDVSEIVAGTLILDLDTVFTSGGTYLWSVQDVTNNLEGYSRLIINGNLLLTAAPGGFTMDLLSFDANGDSGLANITMGQTYSLPILQTTGTITGFDPAMFTFDVSGLQGGSLNPDFFSVSLSGSNTLLLNFAAVPEPSTYALLVLGGGFLGLRAWRRRRG